MEEHTATVEMDERGRLYVPAPVRKSLGVHDTRAIVKVDVEVLEVLEDES